MKYKAYGLIWESVEPLPFVEADDGGDVAADIVVSFDCNRPERINGTAHQRTLTHNPDGFELRFETSDGHWGSYRFTIGTGQLDVSSSREHDQCWPPLVGVVPAVMLRARGQTLLHGAMLSIDGRGVAIIGEAGAGKSTLAAQLVARGAAVVTDDLIVGHGSEVGQVERGYTNIGVYPETAASLAIDQAARVGIRDGDGKVQIASSTIGQPVASLAAVIALGGFDASCSTPRLRHLSVAHAAAVLRSNLYGEWIAPVTAADLAFCLTWAKHVPVCALHRPCGLEWIDASAALIETLSA